MTHNPKSITKSNTIWEQFLSTTKRTVGVMLDLNQSQVSFWMNGRILKKNKTKDLKMPGLTWYPYIRLQEPNIPVVLNPFCRLPMADTLAPKFRKKLPESLINHNLSHSQVTFLKTKLAGKYLLTQLPKQDNDEQLAKTIKDIDPEIEVKLTHLFEKKGGIKRTALVTIEDFSQARKWFTKVALKEYSLLDAEKIAKMLLSEKTSVNSALGFTNVKAEMVKAFLSEHSAELKSKLFSEGELEKYMAQMGLEGAQPSAEKPSDKVTEIKSQLKSQTISAPSENPNKQQLSNIFQVSYLKNTDRILMTNGA